MNLQVRYTFSVIVHIRHISLTMQLHSKQNKKHTNLLASILSFASYVKEKKKQS